MYKNIKLFNFNNSYTLLPDQFYRKVKSVKVASPSLIAFNENLAIELGMQDNPTNDKSAWIFFN